MDVVVIENGLSAPEHGNHSKEQLTTCTSSPQPSLEESSVFNDIHLETNDTPFDVNPEDPAPDVECKDHEPRQSEREDEQFNLARISELEQRVQGLFLERDQLLHEKEKFAAVTSERDTLAIRISELEALVKKVDEHWQERLKQSKQEYETQIVRLQKERDSMVVKYAHSEKEVIGLQNYRDTSERKLRDLAKERDLLLDKVKHLNGEKSKICHSLDLKCNELFTMQKEMERMKEELNSREIKVRWAQSKLKAECDSHKETMDKVENLVQQLRHCREENEQLKANCSAIQERKDDAIKLDHAQILEEKAKLIVEKQNLEDQSAFCRNIQKEFENLKVQHTQLVEENSVCSKKLQTAQRDKLENEQQIQRLREQLAQQKEDFFQLQTKAAEMEGVQMQLERERERMELNQQLLDQVKQMNSDLEEDVTRCRQKETELLEFTQKLTEKNVQLQSTCTSLQQNVSSLENQLESVRSLLESTSHELRDARASLAEEREQRLKEGAVWAKNVAEKTRMAEDLQTQLRETQNELASSSRKYAANVKELTRELKNTKRRLDQLEMRPGGSGCNSNDVVSLGSRASSSNSINTAGIDPSSPEQSPTPPQPHQLSSDWEKTALMEKLVQVQRDGAKMREKIDFLEEHVQHLVAELKRKNRILQYYFMREEGGALVNEASDKHKAELAKHSGVMASMYNHKSLDNGLTLELSLEINQKLQAILEDTLLKNITLKENLSTLGAEIAKLTQQHQALLQRHQKR